MSKSSAITLARGCDRCGAPFADIATLPSGKGLQFCAHHARAHDAALTKAGATWQFGLDHDGLPIMIKCRYLGNLGRVLRYNGGGSCDE